METWLKWLLAIGVLALCGSIVAALAHFFPTYRTLTYLTTGGLALAAVAVWLMWPTIDEPMGLGPIATILITGFLAVLTVTPFASLVTYGAVSIGAFPGWSLLAWSLWFLLTIGCTLLLLSHPATLGPALPVKNPEPEDADSARKLPKRMLPVPPNFAAIPLWLNARFKRFFFKEGAIWVPWWLGFTVSQAPVSETKVQFHDEQGRPLPEQNRGHFRPEEAFGYVFIGKRTIQEVVLVQSADLIRVTADANAVVQVENPVKWQAADNPYGTVIGRLEASLRTAIARFHAEDANAVRSLFPSLLLGSVVLFIKVRKQEGTGDFVQGDLIRNLAGERIVEKTKTDRKSRKASAADRRKLVTKANRLADPACVPQGGFTEDMVEDLEVSDEYLKELYDYGGAKRHMAIKDISLPKSIEDAAANVAKERREQVAEVIQAETAYQVAGKHKQAIDDHGHEAAQLAMIDREKATAVAGWGNNPIAQAAGLFKQGGTNP